MPLPIWSDQIGRIIAVRSSWSAQPTDSPESRVKSVETMSKHEEIADSLTRDILTGQYRVGERLPSERDLSSRFEANRGAVREAMKKLNLNQLKVTNDEGFSCDVCQKS